MAKSKALCSECGLVKQGEVCHGEFLCDDCMIDDGYEPLDSEDERYDD